MDNPVQYGADISYKGHKWMITLNVFEKVQIILNPNHDIQVFHI